MSGEEPSDRNRLAGLLFADDVVLLAPTPETLAASMEQVSAWTDRWKMNVGASKCGVMLIHGDSQCIRNRSWRLQNQEIPIVEKYRYLGVCLTPTLDEKAHIDEMIAKMHRGTAIARPFLSDPSICIAIRTRALRMCIIQPATWGAELCGIKHKNASRLQTAANRAMRLVGVGCSVQSRATNPLTLGLELQIPSIEAIAACCQARVWAKRAHHAHLVQSEFHADPNALQEILDGIDADLVGAPLRRKHAPQSFPRNIEGSRRL